MGRKVMNLATWRDRGLNGNRVKNEMCFMNGNCFFSQRFCFELRVDFIGWGGSGVEISLVRKDLRISKRGC